MDAPPPQCANLKRFAKNKARLLKDTIAEYAEVSSRDGNRQDSERKLEMKNLFLILLIVSNVWLQHTILKQMNQLHHMTYEAPQYRSESSIGNLRRLASDAHRAHIL